MRVCFDFNSIKVRLKLSTADTTSGDGRFQFHKGTIKTGKRNAGLSLAGEFQFHKGTIKTYLCPYTCWRISISIP